MSRFRAARAHDAYGLVHQVGVASRVAAVGEEERVLEADADVIAVSQRGLENRPGRSPFAVEQARQSDPMSVQDPVNGFPRGDGQMGLVFSRLEQHAQAPLGEATCDEGLRIGDGPEPRLDPDATAAQEMAEIDGTRFGEVDGDEVRENRPPLDQGHPAGRIGFDPGARGEPHGNARTGPPALPDDLGAGLGIQGLRFIAPPGMDMQCPGAGRDGTPRLGG